MAKRTLNVAKMAQEPDPKTPETNVADTTLIPAGETVVTETQAVEDDQKIEGMPVAASIEPTEGQNAAASEETDPNAPQAPTSDPAPLPFRSFVSDSGELTDEELAKLLPSSGQERRPDVVTDNLPQAPTITEKTMSELSLGRAQVASPLVHEVSETVANAQNAVAERTRQEQEAGREAVARKQAEYDRARRITAEADARKLREGAAADPGDLGYSQPR